LNTENTKVAPNATCDQTSKNTSNRRRKSQARALAIYARAFLPYAAAGTGCGISSGGAVMLSSSHKTRVASAPASIPAEKAEPRRGSANALVLGVGS
jgi:hypothetical protein